MLDISIDYIDSNQTDPQIGVWKEAIGYNEDTIHETILAFHIHLPPQDPRDDFWLLSGTKH